MAYSPKYQDFMLFPVPVYLKYSDVLELFDFKLFLSCLGYYQSWTKFIISFCIDFIVN